MRGRLALIAVLLLAAGVVWWTRFHDPSKDGEPRVHSSDGASSVADPEATSEGSSAPGAEKSGLDALAGSAGTSSQARDDSRSEAAASAPGRITIAGLKEKDAPGLASLTPRDKPSGENDRRPRYWFPCGAGSQAGRDHYRFLSDGAFYIEGTWSASVTTTVPSPSPAGGGFCQQVSATEYRGKRVAFSAFLRTRMAAEGARVVVRADSMDGRVVGFARSRGGGGPDDSVWYPYTVVIDIPTQAHQIMVGAVLTNSGSLWIDDASLQVVDSSWPLTRTEGQLGYPSGLQGGANLPASMQDPGFEATIEVVRGR